MKTLHKTLLILLALSFLFIFTLPVEAVTVTRCQESIQKKINKQLENFTEDLSKNLAAKSPKSATLPELIKKMRNFNCELEKICFAVRAEFYYKILDCISEDKTKEEQQKCLPKFTVASPRNKSCDSIDTSYKIEDFKEDQAICHLDHSNLTDNYVHKACLQKINNTKTASSAVAYHSYSQKSKQENVNYYSAKLLTITTRLKKLGDQFQRLKEKMSAAFSQICKCSS
jgi:hypothetical protein